MAYGEAAIPPRTLRLIAPARASLVADDAVILLGASCGGAADYSMIAEELGYGRLSMPHPCDAHIIRAQLERCLAH